MTKIFFLGPKSIELEKFSYAVAESISNFSNSSELFDAVEKNARQGLIVIGSEIQLNEAIVIGERIRDEFPDAKVLLSRKQIDVDVLSKALRAGFAEVVTAEDTSGIVQSIRHIREIISASQSKNRNAPLEKNKKGKVVVVFSAKGGCGKTTLSINLATALTNSERNKVCLVDLDLQFGDVAVSLQASPEKTISAAIGMGANLDLLGTRSIITNYDSDLDLLLAPTNPTDVEFISGELVEKILSNLVNDYDFVVIDTPPAFTDFVLKSIEMMDACYLITTLEMPAIKNLKIVLETLDALKVDQSIVRLVINRSDSKTGVSPSEVEVLLQRVVDYELPNEVNVPVAANQGQPLIRFAPKSQLGKVISRMVNDLAIALFPELENNTPVSKSLFRRGK